MKKPTKNQQSILDKMNDGFELTFRSSSRYPFRFARLTKESEDGKGISEDINLKSFDSLISNGYIIECQIKSDYKTKYYILNNEYTIS